MSESGPGVNDDIRQHRRNQVSFVSRAAARGSCCEFGSVRSSGLIRVWFGKRVIVGSSPDFSTAFIAVGRVSSHGRGRASVVIPAFPCALLFDYFSGLLFAMQPRWYSAIHF